MNSAELDGYFDDTKVIRIFNSRSFIDYSDIE